VRRSSSASQPLPKAGDQDQRARRRGAHGDVEHRQRLGAAEVADRGVLGRDQRCGADADALGDRLVDPGERRRHREVRDLGRRDAGVGEALADRRRRDLHVALVAHPALFPAVLVVAAGFAEVIDEIGVFAAARQQRGDRRTAADERAGGAVAEDHFLRARGLGDAALGGEEHGRRTAGRPAQRGRELGQCGAGARGRIAQDRRRRDADRRGDDAGVQALGERQRGRGERELPGCDRRARALQLASGLDRHGDRVFVPVGDRPLALGERTQAGRHPEMPGEHLAALEAPARHVSCAGQEAVRGRAVVHLGTAGGGIHDVIHDTLAHDQFTTRERRAPQRVFPRARPGIQGDET
jgi:hypothetical protein